jgi:aspartate kinase
MKIRVFKFGGASINSAAGVRNVTSILKKSPGQPLLLVVSAMGKTTNSLELVLNHFMNNDPVVMIEAFEKVREYHFNILDGLFPNKDHFAFKEVDSLFNQLRGYLRKGHLYSQTRPAYDFEYDQIISYGELISTAIVQHFLVESGLSSTLFDARQLIRTDNTYRDGRVDWKRTSEEIHKIIPVFFRRQTVKNPIALTQGFIAGDPENNTTTLGREGSDFSAAIFAYCLKTTEVTIWKDVPGVLNADPKWFINPRKLQTLSYREAIELAYYGASIIHPKTIKPLENANITLYVKSFLKPGLKGTTVKQLSEWKIPFPIYIRKQQQILISMSPRDFSFIMEENLSHIFEIMARHQVKVNLMQNSAISFSVCVDNDPMKIPALLKKLQEAYEIRYNEGVELYTIRHYTPAAIKKITAGRDVLMEQKSRNTLQMVIR